MKYMKNGIKMAVFVVLLMLGVISSPRQEAFAAATPVKVIAVSYTDDSILIMNNENTKIYYATDIEAAKNKWDVIDATGKITAIDISWLKRGSQNILKIKGNLDATEARVILLEEPNKLEVSINYSDLDSLAATDTIGQLLNIRASAGNGVTPITMKDLEWRKGEGGHWLKTDYLTKGLLQSYMAKGVYLFFRIAPVDDVVSGSFTNGDELTKVLLDSASYFAYTKPNFIYTDKLNGAYKTYSEADFALPAITSFPDGTRGQRASSAVKLKISEMKASPTTGIDGSKFRAEIKYGQEYRIITAGGTTPWKQVTDRSIRTIKLSELLGDPAYGATKVYPVMTIEVRNHATSKTASSKITRIVLDKEQRAMPSTDAAITYNGVKNVILTIPAASTSKPYEYCVVKNISEVENARWSKVTKNTGVNIQASKAPDDSIIVVRMMEIKYNGKTNASFELASTYQQYNVSYPAIPKAEPQVYTFTKGYSGDIVIEVTLNESGKLPFETGLKYIKLGTVVVPVKEPVVITPLIEASTPTEKHVMTITIEEATLKSMINCTKKQLSIYYNNGTVDKTSSKLTIKNPSKAPILTVSFKAGTSSGTAFQIVAPKENAVNTWYYAITTAEIKDVNNEDLFTQVMTKATATATPLPVNMDSADNLTITAGSFISIFEVDATGHVVRCISKQIN